MINDDNPQIKVKFIELIDEGNSNEPFIRNFIYDEDGSFLNTTDLDYSGNTYNVVGQGIKANSGTTILDLTNILNGVSIDQLIDVDTTSLVPTIGQVLTWDGTNWIPSTVSGGTGGTSDHGLLVGLNDDDHPQYLTEPRGDIRYYTKTEIDNSQSIQDTNITNNTNNINTNQTNITTNTSDISTINNQQVTQDSAIALNTAKVSFPEAPIDGTPYLRQDSSWVSPEEKHYDFIQKISDNISETGINNTTTFETYLSLSTTVPRDGIYKLSWFYIWSYNDGAQDFEARILINGVETVFHKEEPKDAAGTGAGLLQTTGTATNTGTDQRHLTTGFWTANLTSGVNTIEIQWKSQGAGDEASIYQGQIDIEEK